MSHDTYVHSFNGAGQKNHRAQCRDCPWHGATTSDRTRAEQEAADHELARVRGGAL